RRETQPVKVTVSPVSSLRSSPARCVRNTLVFIPFRYATTSPSIALRRQRARQARRRHERPKSTRLRCPQRRRGSIFFDARPRACVRATRPQFLCHSFEKSSCVTIFLVL